MEIVSRGEPSTQAHHAERNQRLPYHKATAIPADTALVIRGSAHCGPKCDGCANTSPISVTTALSVAWRPTLLVLRSIWMRSATVTTAPTVPQIVARSTCSTLNAAKTLPRAMTSRQASHAPPNFSAAGLAGELPLHYPRHPNLALPLCIYSCVSNTKRPRCAPDR